MALAATGSASQEARLGAAGKERRSVMSDVKVELTEVVSRDDAAAWLSTLSRAFGSDGHVELPIGSTAVKVHVPDQVTAELEVEVDGDEVEIEVEFEWSMAGAAKGLPAEQQAQSRTRARRNNSSKSADAARRLARPAASRYHAEAATRPKPDGTYASRASPGSCRAGREGPQGRRGTDGCSAAKAARPRRHRSRPDLERRGDGSASRDRAR
jgi:amphi-Trp domain-containing protein